jgi:hypothetical protein
MFAWGDRLKVVVTSVVVMAAGPAAAQGAETVSVPEAVSEAVSVPAAEAVSETAPVSVAEAVSVPEAVSVSVLMAPVQGSESLRALHGERVEGAVRRAFEVRGYSAAAAGELLGQSVVACQTPECVVQVLDAADAAFAIVPAIWSRERGGEELTLTLVQKSERSLNARGVVGEDLSGTAADLVDELLTRHAAAASEAEAPSPAVPTSAMATASEPEFPHAWKAGPIILIAGGAAAVIAVGVAAGIRNDTQQLNSSAVAAWSAIGAAAIAGGIAWWVVGERRRQRKAEPTSALAPTIAFHPTGIDLRLRF